MNRGFSLEIKDNVLNRNEKLPTDFFNQTEPFVNSFEEILNCSMSTLNISMTSGSTLSLKKRV